MAFPGIAVIEKDQDIRSLRQADCLFYISGVYSIFH